MIIEAKIFENGKPNTRTELPKQELKFVEQFIK